MKQLIVSVFIISLFTSTAHAQLLQKLGKTVERAAEKALDRKVEQKTTEVTNQAVDSLLYREQQEKQDDETSLFGISKATPASTYSFEHKAVMRMTSGKDEMDIDYYLPDSGNYFCTVIRDEKIKDEMYTVLDIEREAIFTYMENAGQRIKMAINFKADDIEDTSGYEIEDTGNQKTIQGYNCKEYKVTGADMIANIWVTKEVDLRFPTYMYSKKKGQSNHQEWIKELDGWAMVMTMIDTSKKKPQTVKMNCLSVGKSNLRIHSSDYSNLGF